MVVMNIINNAKLEAERAKKKITINFIGDNNFVAIAQLIWHLLSELLRIMGFYARWENTKFTLQFDVKIIAQWNPLNWMEIIAFYKQ